MMLAWLLYRRQITFDPALGPLVTGVYGGNSIDAMITEVQTSIGLRSCSRHRQRSGRR